MIQFIIIKGSTGYDVSNLFDTIVWGGRKGAAPRNVKITLLDDDGAKHNRVSVDCEKGDQCVMYEDGKELFRGIIVDHEQNEKKKLVITAYDNAYYLANNKDSFCYTNKKASEIFTDCMTRIGMTGGEVVDTTYVIPELPKAKTTYYDVLLDALSMTYKATGIRHYIVSEKGNIHLRRRSEQTLGWVLEVGGNITNYSYKKSIVGIKTRVRLLSKEDVVVYEQVNDALEGNIGAFMEVKSVNDSYNQAQMKELVESIFSEKGSPVKTLKVSGVGISDAISGTCVFVEIPHLGIKRAFYIDEDTHTFTRKAHKMTLKLNYADDITDSSVTTTSTSTSKYSSGYRVGDVVHFKGGNQYASSNATKPIGSKQSAGPAKITSIVKGAKHPFHIVHTDRQSKVYGWVDEGTFS